MLQLPPFRLADGSTEARWQTRVELGWDEQGLEVVFTCEDDDAWGTFERRDDPIWQEEAVEVFLAAGAEVPKTYYEIEISPRGMLFDAKVDNPHSRRDTMRVDVGWDWAGIEGQAESRGERQDWRARLFLPWRGLGLDAPPPVLRANFYRIERPRHGAAEFSCWSPTLTSPPDFHKPERFGTLLLEGLEDRLPQGTAAPSEPVARVPRRPR